MRLVIGNGAQYGGSINLEDFSRATFSYCNFTDNSAIEKGGAISAQRNAFIVLFGSFMTNNRAGYGGAMILTDNCTAAVLNCTFVDNTVTSSGGVFFIQQNSTFHIYGSHFLRNKARDGGSLFIENFANGTVSNCNFTNNTVTAVGGALEIRRNSSLNIQRSFLLSKIFIPRRILGVILNNEAQHGGSISIEVYSSATVSQCNFTKNVANEGGAIDMYDNASIALSDSIFLNNEGFYGGAIFLEVNSNGTISQCSFMGNTGLRTADNEALYGGSISVESSSNALISNCRFTNNTAKGDGGVIYILHEARVVLLRSIFISNEAISGGAMFLQNFANVKLVDCNFVNNTATNNGGAICIEQNSTLVSLDSTFSNNQAVHGGAIYLTSSIMSLESIILNSNHATRGGALYSWNATMNIINSIFNNNRADDLGGAIHAVQSNTTIENTAIQSNKAHMDCGGICATEKSQLEGTDLSIRSNSAGSHGGGIVISNSSSVLCYSCKILNNTAYSGAGLYAYSNNSIPIVAQLQNSRFENNSAHSFGGGITFDASLDSRINCSLSNIACGQIILLNTIFVGNFANLSGAAILTKHANGVLIDCDLRERIRSFVNEEEKNTLTSIHPTKLCSSWSRNEISNNTFEAVVSTYGQEIKLTIARDEEVELNGSPSDEYVLENVSSGEQLPMLDVTVLDGFGNGPAPTLQYSFLARLYPPNNVTLGEHLANISVGFGHFSNVTLFARPGNYTIELRSENMALRTVQLRAIVRKCHVDEEPTNDYLTCQKCDVVSYSFHPSEVGACTQCPNGGNCTGRYIISDKGYWHKSPCHSTVQKCLIEEACDSENRYEDVINFTHTFNDCNINETELEAYNDVLCNKGYKGLLCGSCKNSFGLSARFLCSSCSSPILSFLNIVGIALYLLAAATFTIRGCLPFGFQPQNNPSISRHASNDVGHSGRDSQVNIEMIEMLGGSHVSREYFEERRTMNNTIQRQTSNASQVQTLLIQQENEYDLTKWRITEIFKIMINFLQTIAIASNLNVQWSDGILSLFTSSEYLGALTTVAISRPIDCIVSSNSAATKAIRRMLVSLLVPGFVLGVLALFWAIITIRNAKDWYYFLKRCTLSVIAITYISYLGMTKMAVRAFYCVDVYDSINYSIPSKHKFWAIDTAIRAFKEKFAYWESIVMFRKACLSVIVVFSYPLGGDSQGLLASILLFFCLYIHLTIKPYRKEFKILNHYESMALLVSGLTFNLGVFFVNDRCIDSIRTLLAILIILGNSVFFLVLCLAFFYHSMVHLRVVLQCENIPLPDPPIWWNILKVYLATRIARIRQSLN
eukprot:g3775.t1